MQNETTISNWKATAFIVGMLAMIAAAIYASGPPRPLPADADKTDFSAHRAIQHIKQFANEPHPSGTPANDKVRQYIVHALKEMDIPYEEDVAIVPMTFKISEVHNILVRIPGTANTKAFALVAHYDSTPFGPGAADDGAGIATMLETARAIKAGPPLMNDLILVFTEGEERGLVGARAFCSHAWAQDVGVLLNMEARGISGPSLMYETTDDNGWLIRQLIASGAPAHANSLAYDVSKRMPTSSDLAILRRNGFKGYNIAFIEDFASYHTPNDNPENLSLGSLQNHGEYAIHLARHLGNIPLNNVPDEPDAIYFNLFGSAMASYPASWGVLFTIISSLLAAAVLVAGVALGYLTIGGIVLGALVVLGAAAASVVVCGIVMALAYYFHYIYVLYRTSVFTIFFLSSAISLTAIFLRATSRQVSTPDLLAGALVWWLAMLLIIQIAFPYGGFAPLVPLLLGVVGLVFIMGESATPSPWRLCIQSLLSLTVIVFWVPLMRGMFSSLTVIMAPLLMVPVVMLLALMAPQLRYTTDFAPPRGFYGTMAMLFLFVLVSPIGRRSPTMNSVSYGLDRTTGQTCWMSSDDKADEWTQQFFPEGTKKQSIREFVPYEHENLMKSTAPLADLAAPNVEVVSDNKQADGTRRVSLRLTSTAPQLDFFIHKPTRVLEANVDGHELYVGRRHHGSWRFQYEIFPRSGVATIGLLLEDDHSVSGSVIEVSYELPPLDFKPRPYDMINKANTLDWFQENRMRSGHTYVVTPFSF